MATDDSLRNRVRHLRRRGWDDDKVTLQQLAGDASVFSVLASLSNADFKWVSTHLGQGLRARQRTSDDGTSRCVKVALNGSSGVNGFAEFEVETEDGGARKYELKVVVRGATPGAELPVLIGDVNVGSVKIGASGVGVIRFSTRPKAGEVPFPTDFKWPTVDTGTVIDVGGVVQGQLGKSNPGGDIPATETTFEAAVTDGNAEAEFEYEVEMEVDGDEKRKLKVKVKDLTANTDYDVAIDGKVVATIRTDSRGDGLTYITTRPTKPFHQMMSPGFPKIAEGTTAEILGTSLSTTFGKPTVVDLPTGDGGVLKEFQAKLLSSTAMRGSAKFEIDREDGGFLERKFTVTVNRADANRTFQVSVGGFVIGDLTTNSKGVGRLTLSSLADSRHELPMPSTFPTDINGARVMVGTSLQGFLKLDGIERAPVAASLYDAKRPSLLSDTSGFLAQG